MSTAQDGGKKTAEEKVAPATGKLGVMVVGLGAVATTMIAGVEAVRLGLAKPIGSLTQMGTICPGRAGGQQDFAHQRFCAARRSERSGLYRMGHFCRQRV